MAPCAARDGERKAGAPWRDGGVAFGEAAARGGVILCAAKSNRIHHSNTRHYSQLYLADSVSNSAVKFRISILAVALIINDRVRNRAPGLSEGFLPLQHVADVCNPAPVPQRELLRTLRMRHGVRRF